MKTKKKKTKKKSAKRATPKASKPGHMSMSQLLGQLAKALSEPLGSDERRKISLTIANAKQKKPTKKRAR